MATHKGRGEMETGGDGMFVLRDVAKTYGPVRALAALSLEIARGERVALLGPSGSGKTTLLHLLGGVIQPTEGAVIIDGRPLERLNPGRELASLVGIVHQQLDLVPHLSVVHNVMAGRLGQWGLARSLLSLIWPRERTRAEEALERVGIADKIYERTSRLSGGEQQRVAIARVLLQSPRALLADEPVSSLDPARAEDLMRLLVQIAEESHRTLIASLHNVELVRSYFTRAVGLRAGRLEFDLPVTTLTDEMLTRLYELSEVGEDGEKKRIVETTHEESRDAGGERSPHDPADRRVPLEPRRRPVE